MVATVSSTKIFFIGARLCLLTLFCYFSALAVNSGVATWLALPVSTLDQEEKLPPPTIQPKPPLSSYAVVYNRDIFNSVKAPVQADGPSLTNSNPSLKLWGTAVREHDRAFAIIENLGTRLQGLYREGEVIVPGITLVQVGWDRVTIEQEGRRDTLMFPLDASPPPPPVQPPSLLTPSSSAPRLEQGDIRQVAQDSFQVDRRALDHALENMNDLISQARLIPHNTADGGMQGFRLFAIKPQSLFDRLGLKSGDIIQRVNGVELSDPSTALTLLQDIQGRSQMRIDVLRNQQPVTLSYEIR